MTDDRDDYADRDLPPQRSWVRGLLIVMVWLGVIGSIMAAVLIYCIMSLQRFD